LHDEMQDSQNQLGFSSRRCDDGSPDMGPSQCANRFAPTALPVCGRSSRRYKALVQIFADLGSATKDGAEEEAATTVGLANPA